MPAVCSAMTSGALHGTLIARTSSPDRGASDAEMPKSASTGEPKVVIRMLLGLMSRCTSPARCAVSTALAIFTAIVSTSSSGSRSRR